VKAHFVFALALIVAPLVHATDLRITCTPSTKYEDGTSLPAGATNTFSLFGALSGQTKQKLVSNAAACDFLRQNVSTGVQEYYVTQTTNGIESAASVIVSKAVTETVDTDSDGVPDSSDACPTVAGPAPSGCPAPSPPVNVTVETMTAFEWRPATSTMADIGLVPEAMACGPETMVWKTVTYCRVKLADALPIIRPVNKKIREVWVVKPVG
jgi:hypothetical protein